MNYQNSPHMSSPYYPPPEPQYSPEPWYRPIRRNANIVCFGLSVVLSLSVFLTPVFAWMANYYIDIFGVEDRSVLSVIEMTGEILATCLMLIIPITIMRLWIGIPPAVAFPMRRPRASIAIPAVFVCLGVSVLGVLTYGVIAALLQVLFGITPRVPAFPAPKGTVALIIYILRVVLVPAIFEEMMFRGVIMQSLRRFGDMFALVCSSVLFALAHRNIAQGVNAFIVGLAIGFFVLRTGSLRTGILIHFVNNALSVTAELVTRSMSENETAVFALIQFSFYIFSGFIGLVFLSIAQGKIFCLAQSDYPLPEKRKYSVFFLNIMPIVYIVAILAFAAGKL